MRVADYALDLEPTTSGVMNLASGRADGLLTCLNPGESREFKLEIEFTDDEKLINAYKHKA